MFSSLQLYLRSKPKAGFAYLEHTYVGYTES